MDAKSKADPAVNEKPITHLLVAGVGWIPVERGLRVLTSPDRYQWETEGAILTINAGAILGSKRGGRSR